MILRLIISDFLLFIDPVDEDALEESLQRLEVMLIKHEHKVKSNLEKQIDKSGFKKAHSNIKIDEKDSIKSSECITTTNINIPKANRVERPIKSAEPQFKQVIKAKQGQDSYKKWIDQCLQHESKTSSELQRKDFTFNNRELENILPELKSNQLDSSYKNVNDNEESEIEEEIDFNDDNKNIKINNITNSQNNGIYLEDSLDNFDRIAKNSGKVKINPNIDIKALLLVDSP